MPPERSEPTPYFSNFRKGVMDHIVHCSWRQPYRKVVISGVGQVELHSAIGPPACTAHEVIVKVVWVALNPADQKGLNFSPTVGAGLGSDFAGIVVHVGSEVDQRNIHVGQRVCGAVNGNNPARPQIGCFADYVVADPDFILKVPGEMPLIHAVTFPVGLVTCGVALYKEMGLTRPLQVKEPSEARADQPVYSKGPNHVLVYGASTATGSLAIQLLKLSGKYEPIGVCSSRNFAMAKSRGAAAIYDYADANECIRSVKSLAGDSLKYALDCVSNSTSMMICYECIGSQGGRYVALDQFSLRQHTRRSVRPKWILANMTFGDPIHLEGAYKRPADLSFRKFHQAWFEEAQNILSQGLLVPHPIKWMEGGLEGVSHGLDCLRKGEVSGQKLVYHIAENSMEDLEEL